MPIRLMHRYYRQDAINNPEWLFVWGDNLQKIGFGGQAKEMRGESNGVGIPTKNAPGMRNEDFFSDSDILLAQAEFEKQFSRLHRHLDKNGVVIWPADGVGTGLAELPMRAPRIWALLDRYRAELFAYGIEGDDE